MQPRHLNYLAGYPESIQQQAQKLISSGKLAEWFAHRYGQQSHSVQNDKALYEYAMTLKERFMKHAAPLSRVQFDNKLNLVQQALGLNTQIARIQGGKLKAKNEIRIASLFKQTPDAFLRMIVVHELAHLKVKAHDRAFYQLCQHMEPDYHQLEFDLRLYLIWKETTVSPEK